MEDHITASLHEMYIYNIILDHRPQSHNSMWPHVHIP